MFWTDTSLSSEDYYDLSRYFLMLVIFLMVTMMLSSKSDESFDKIKFWLCSAACISAIIMVLIFYESNNFPRARVYGYFEHTYNPNQASMYFGFIGILAFHSILGSKCRWHKIFYWFVLLTVFGYILLCQSRGPLLAFIIALVMESILGKNWKMIGIFITLFIVLMVFLEFYDLGIRGFYERGIPHRLIILKGAIKHISEAPLFGKGWFADVDMMIGKDRWAPHNLLLLVSAKSGVIGGGLLLLLILTTFVNSYKYFVASGNWIFISIFVYFIVCMTFDYTHILYKPNLGWIIFWMPIAQIAGEEIRLKNLALRLPK
jgi:O-antigen ligase